MNIASKFWFLNSFLKKRKEKKRETHLLGEMVDSRAGQGKNRRTWNIFLCQKGSAQSKSKEHRNYLERAFTGES